MVVPNRLAVLLAVLLGVLPGCGGKKPAEAQRDDSPLALYMEEFFDAWVQRDPEWYSELRPFGDAIDPYGDALTDVSPLAQRERLGFASDALERLRGFDLTTESPRMQIAAQSLEWYLDDIVRSEPFLLSDYPVNQFDGDQLQLVTLMTDVHVLRRRTDASNYVLRLSRFGRRIDQLLEGLEAREAKGVVPPRPIIEKSIEGMKAFVETEPRRNLLFLSFAGRIRGISELGPSDYPDLQNDVLSAIETTVYPAYQRLIDHYEALLPKAPVEAGVWRQPDGDAYYAYLVRHHTTLELTPDQIHKRGQREVRRLQTQLSGVLAALGFDAKVFGDAMRAYRESFALDGPHYHPNTQKGRSEALTEYGAIIGDSQRAIAGQFGKLPLRPVAVRPVPPYAQAGATATTYVPPSLDGHRGGIVYVNLAEPVFKPAMQTLAYHEAVPGHHTQFALQRGSQQLPTFSRVVSYTAFAEGWAFYAERLALENGLYTDPHASIAALWYDLLRAARLVVDTGIHHHRWSREEAMKWMRRNLGFRSEAQVDRYIARPGEALAYKIGALRIRELRRATRKAQGADFDVAAFHQQVLGNGSLPLSVLGQVMAPDPVPQP